MREYLVAVDVGTTSARAGIFARDGHMLAKARHPIEMRRGPADFAEHDSEDIWRATCVAVRQALSLSGLEASQVAGFGFDATCSLVIRDRQGTPLSVSETGDPRFDTIVWLDHRAVAEAEEMNATGHPVLAYVGGSLSPEMQIPKLMWFKRHMPQQWEGAGFFFDLADFLTWRATGSPMRSRSTLTAKWNYLAYESEGWNADYLAHAGLQDFREKGGLPDRCAGPGEAIGTLSAKAAEELGLDQECVVAAGLIDAYAGGLGLLAGVLTNDEAVEGHAALIGGTSSCLVAFSRKERHGASLWGPFFEAALDRFWLVEGSQSATGALLDHIVRMHASGGEPDAARHQAIIDRIFVLREQEGERFGEGLHVLPDFHGNRSPLANPRAKGVISGLTRDTSFDGLCRLYWRTCVALVLGLRHILEVMEEIGYRFDMLHAGGGHVHNPLLVELYADVTGRSVRIPKVPDAVLLGSAMAASVAAGFSASMAEAGRAMDQGGTVRECDPQRKGFYDRDFKRFMAMHRHRSELEAI
ncbi:FGGY-family carbohydrate kinase [Rhizobium sp. FKY42]|uniref:FGGY-family carbohydrate kinase n=1 Tax=Rhizobium sp. FKY42 TaxID=2562310 RepID=UPI0010C049E0|nr:FGGY-family carbohydrate kinase [Rhizobium sp. FKY42]